MLFHNNLYPQTIPTPLRVQISPILKRNNNRCERASVHTSCCRGSLTIEAALAVTFFAFILAAILNFFLIINVQTTIQKQMEEAAEQAITIQTTTDLSVETLLSLYVRGSIATSTDYAGINILSTNVSCDNDWLDIQVTYRITAPFGLPDSMGITLMQRSRKRFWYGNASGTASGKLDISDDGEYVYIAQNASVYHTTIECTHLNLSISTVSHNTVDSLRNDYGNKYYACELCVYGTGSVYVYITPTGTAWHNVSSCPGLKRSITQILLSAAQEKGLGPCSRCGR